MAKKAKTILLSLNPVIKVAKAGRYMGWVEPRDYSPVRGLMNTLKVGSYTTP